MARLFGTDGVRGVVGQEITCELAMELGKAAAQVLADGCTHTPLVVLGKDTRISGEMLGAAFSAGLCAAGANVLDLGVVSTPAVAYLIKKYKADAGVMISASHNPWQFNGIKLFNKNGFKLPDEMEDKIEELVRNGASKEIQSGMTGTVSHSAVAVTDYVEYLKSTASCNLDGMKIAVDCANGSASVSAAQLLEALGAQPVFFSCQPNGTNINLNCGSTHMEDLKHYVRAHDDIVAGVAFDGDADRCLFVDENGEEVDGDFIMAICGLHLKQDGVLNGNTIVGTVMTNLGFVHFCERNGIRFEATKVGDRYVLEKMEQEGYVLGGEQSGHIIFRNYATTGDGQLTAVQLLCMMKQQGKKLSEMASVMKKMPQVMVNVQVSAEGKLRFYNDQTIAEEIEAAKAQLGSRGRVLVRLSGTEPLIRVMAEGEDLQEIDALTQKIAKCIAAQLV